MSSRAGSNAGRGFRFQDAVAAWLATEAWASDSGWGLVIPEGSDDVELRGVKGVGFAQVKSRRSHLGAFSAGDAAGFIRALWDRHDAAASPPDLLMLVVERAIAGMSATAVETEIDAGSPLATLLDRDNRSASLLAKTRVMVVAGPQESSIDRIASYNGCRPVAAQICFAEIVGRIGALSDSNGRRGPHEYLGLSRSDVDAVISAMLGVVDIEAIDRAISEGLCEAVDFVTPLDDPNFYLGVDVEPGHIAAGLVAERPAGRDAVASALESRGNALVVGPSGAGKSALMWEAAYAVRHTVRWYRVRRLEAGEVPAVRQLARTLRASERSPVGFVFDDVGRNGFEGWSQLTREAASEEGIILLGSVREEDIFLLAERARSVEVRAEGDDELAERLWEELRSEGRTQWEGWREPWGQSQHLLLEYVHMLTQGERMAAVLADQVAARARDPERAVELSILRIGACAGAASALVDTERLGGVLGQTEAKIGRALRRLVEEHLVRAIAPGMLGGLHQLRSQELVRLCHDIPPPTYARTFALTALCTPAADLEPLVADAMGHARTDTSSIMTALIARLESDPDPRAMRAILRGLGEGHIAASVDRWLALPEVDALPRTQVTTAARFGIANIDLSALDMLPGIVAAANHLTIMAAASDEDPRRLLLAQLATSVLGAVFDRTTDIYDLEAFLAALVGQSLSPELRSSLANLRPNLLGADLDAVAALLGTLAAIDRSLAIEWVDRVEADFLLARVSREIPWAADAATREDRDGPAACCDYWYAAASHQPDPHADVVRLCELLLALSPRAEFAVSTALAPNGEAAGIPGFSLATKRIPRSNLPPAALPEWNRRWIEAIAFRVGASNYTEYLSRGIALLDAMVPILEAAFDRHLRGRYVPAGLILPLNELNAEAERLTPPRRPLSGAAGPLCDEANTAVTGFQHVLHEATVNVVKRYAQLPEDAGAYIAWLADLTSNIDAAITDEPWHLVAATPPQALGRLRELLETLRLLASEAQLRGEAPALSWRAVVRKARPRNAMRVVAAVARAASDRRHSLLRAELERGLVATGIATRLYLRESSDGILSWPSGEILLLVQAEDVLDAQLQLQAVVGDIRGIIDARFRLCVIPQIGDVVVDRLALSGHETLFPMPGDCASWIDELAFPRLASPATDAFDQSISAAGELASLDRLDLGVTGRPGAELNVRDALESLFARVNGALADALTVRDADLVADALALVAQIRSGAIDASADLQAALRGEEPVSLQQIGVMTMAILQADLDGYASSGRPHPDQH